MIKYDKIIMQFKELVHSLGYEAIAENWNQSDASCIAIEYSPNRHRISLCIRHETTVSLHPSSMIDDSPDKDMSGYIYILKADNGLYKIGRTKIVNDRIQQISPKLPYAVELVNAIEVSDYIKVENQLHEIFTDAGKHIRGEWFDLNETDLEYIKSFDISLGRGG